MGLLQDTKETEENSFAFAYKVQSDSNCHANKKMMSQQNLNVFKDMAPG